MIWRSDGDLRSAMATTMNFSGDTANNIHKSPNSSVVELLKVMPITYNI